MFGVQEPRRFFWHVSCQRFEGADERGALSTRCDLRDQSSRRAHHHHVRAAGSEHSTSIALCSLRCLTLCHSVDLRFTPRGGATTHVDETRVSRIQLTDIQSLLGLTSACIRASSQWFETELLR